MMRVQISPWERVIFGDFQLIECIGFYQYMHWDSMLCSLLQTGLFNLSNLHDMQYLDFCTSQQSDHLFVNTDTTVRILPSTSGCHIRFISSSKNALFSAEQLFIDHLSTLQMLYTLNNNRLTHVSQHTQLRTI